MKVKLKKKPVKFHAFLSNYNCSLKPALFTGRKMKSRCCSNFFERTEKSSHGGTIFEHSVPSQAIKFRIQCATWPQRFKTDTNASSICFGRFVNLTTKSVARWKFLNWIKRKWRTRWLQATARMCAGTGSSFDTLVFFRF